MQGTTQVLSTGSGNPWRPLLERSYLPNMGHGENTTSGLWKPATGIATTGSLLNNGVSRWTIDANSRQLLHGVRAFGDIRSIGSAPRWADDLWFKQRELLSAVQSKYPEATGVGPTAGALYGMVLPYRLQREELVFVSTGRGGRQIRMKNVRSNRKPIDKRVLWFDLPVASGLEVMAQIAAELNFREAVQLLDGLLGTWNGGPKVDHAKLKSFIRELPQSRSYRTLRKALPLARPGVQSPRETSLRLEIIRAGLPEPAVNPRVYLPSIGDCRKPDLAWEEYKVCCEYEGIHHMTDADQWSSDIRRYRAFEAAGWTVIRVTKSMPSAEYLQAIRDALRARGWKP